MVPAFELYPVVHGSDPESDTRIRDDNLEGFAGLEEVAREGVEIYFTQIYPYSAIKPQCPNERLTVRALRVPLLTTRVEGKIKRPA